MTAQERDEGSLLAPGDLVSGEYVVDAVAQKGAGWIWYRGHHVERADELVTITSLRADAPSAGYIEAFARRSQWLADARLPNVPPLLASGVEMGLPFIVTPWVDGTTLRELLDVEGSLSRDEALRIIKSVGESLDAMHARRPVVVHQLLSLNNIRIDAMTRAARIMDAGVAHALRLARVEDVHGAAKVEGVFRAPEDNVGRTPAPAVDRYALAKLAESLLAPVPAGSTLARVLSRGSSDLSASRFSTCASFVQSLALALKETRPEPAVSAGSATGSPGASAVASATKSPGAAAIASATSSPSPTAMSAATESPSDVAIAAATSSPAASAVAAATNAPSGPSLSAATQSPSPSTVASATSSPANSLAAATKTAPLPTASAKPMPPPAPRATKSTLVGVAPPGLPKKGKTSTLVGIAPPLHDLLAQAAAPAPVAAPTGVVPPPLASEPSESERFPFAPEATKTERVEIDPSMRDSSLDEEIAVSEQSIMEVVPAVIASTPEKKPAERFSEPAPFEIDEPPLKAEPAALDVAAPIAAPSLVESATKSPTPSVSAAADVGLAKTLLSSVPMAPSQPVVPRETIPLPLVVESGKSAAPEVSVELGEDVFPAIPPLDSTEKERQASAGMDVPPLFEAAPPVPAPISPDATSGMPPVSVEKARRSRTVAIAAAVVLGLVGGVAGGVVIFKRVMQGETIAGQRGVGTSVDDAGSGAANPQLVHTQPEAEDAAVAANAGNGTTEDAAVVGQDDDAAVVATEDAGVAIANNAEPEDSGASAPGNTVGADGVLLVAGTSGLSSPDWRIRGGARRAVRERVEACGQGQTRGTARFNVRFDGTTGRVIQFVLAGAQFRDTPVGACVERAMRSVAVPPFTDEHWDTDYAVPLR